MQLGSTAQLASHLASQAHDGWQHEEQHLWQGQENSFFSHAPKCGLQQHELQQEVWQPQAGSEWQPQVGSAWQPHVASHFGAAQH